MRGRKETLGSIKEGTKSRSRKGAMTSVKGSMKPSVRTSGHAGSGHGDLSHGSRKTRAGKGGAHK